MKMTHQEEDDHEEDLCDAKMNPNDKQLNDGDVDDDNNEESSSEEVTSSHAKPIGKHVRVSKNGRKHFQSFELDKNRYTLEDTVLLAPETQDKKPFVAIIKDIEQSLKGNLKITTHLFYRPDEAERRRGHTWKSKIKRELFYSFHQYVVPAENVMHTCAVHFIPVHKKLPTSKEVPGFIVQKVYNTKEKKLRNLTDKVYDDNQQQEMDNLVQKTIQRLGELPDIIVDKKDLTKKSISPHYDILVKFNALTGETSRDEHLVMLLQNVQYLFDSDDNSDAISNGNSKSFVWPDVAVQAVVALEKASHDTFSPNYQNYSEKIQNLAFNLKVVSQQQAAASNSESESFLLFPTEDICYTSLQVYR
ncbi:bromo-adjacent-like (BAH) domain protein [Medicago truncatula]|uniref:Bromo-adjacent-like (BAH) domain protein n=1 Tax=Medicago truncatula TaxID=3880 RepID=A0A072U9T0_MEDTR|nr:bromo-adjacent-like (BAH) domain protein [Medicago truncatula]